MWGWGGVVTKYKYSKLIMKKKGIGRRTDI